MCSKDDPKCSDLFQLTISLPRTFALFKPHGARFMSHFGWLNDQQRPARWVQEMKSAPLCALVAWVMEDLCLDLGARTFWDSPHHPWRLYSIFYRRAITCYKSWPLSWNGLCFSVATQRCMLHETITSNNILYTYFMHTSYICHTYKDP